MRQLGRVHRRNYNLTRHAHVLTFSCYHGFKFLSSDRTCQWLADAIENARRNLEFAVWAYVFMPEHVHLLIYPLRENYDIGQIRHAIKHPVGDEAIRFLQKNAPEWLPRITRVRGRKTERLFWQSGGGYDRNIDEPKTFGQEIEYIHMNPVRRGLVTSAADWRWSSAGWFIDQRESRIIPDKIPADWTR